MDSLKKMKKYICSVYLFLAIGVASSMIDRVHGSSLSETSEMEVDESSCIMDLLQNIDSPMETIPTKEDLDRAITASLNDPDLDCFFEFVKSLGPSIRWKQQALLHIKKNLRKYPKLHKIPGWTVNKLDQMLRFISENIKELSTEEDSQNKMQYNGVNLHFRVKSGYMSYECRYKTEHLDNARDRIIGMQRKGFENKDLGAAIYLLFSVAEIAFDFSVQQNKIILSLIDECKDSTPKGNYIDKNIYDFCGASMKREEMFNIILQLNMLLNAFYSNVLNDVELEKYYGETTEKIVNSLNSMFFSDTGKQVPYMEITKGSISRLYSMLYRFFALFYAICPYAGENMVEFVGKDKVVTEKYYKNFYRINNRTMELVFNLDFVCPKKTEVQATGNRLPSSRIKLHRVNYVDNSERMQKPVIIPMTPHGIPCATIIAQISQMYGRPQSNIHVLGLNPKTRKWTYRSPHDTMYFTESLPGSEILVFYYISEANSPNCIINGVLAEYASYHCKESMDSRPLRFPLIIDFMMVCATRKLTLQRSAMIESAEFVDSIPCLKDLVDREAYVFMDSADLSSVELYPQMKAEFLEDSESLDMDMLFAKGNLVTERSKFSDADGWTDIMYSTRITNFCQHSNIYMDDFTASYLSSAPGVKDSYGNTIKNIVFSSTEPVTCIFNMREQNYHNKLVYTCLDRELHLNHEKMRKSLCFYPSVVSETSLVTMEPSAETCLQAIGVHGKLLIYLLN
ncbi:uncharacterized protein NEMAJ01_0175 [Nematocida major]|uniref:uncharacterized protein n=1 Tax=Nematocida major TaxID=1912982 RepID=UPI002008E1EA|nr:uncharacterized protein NEMAJ01_0175 [Nematocida major]KAH9385279.1 hypothetical protein NEMAJ01_0175 [Nematocida major]